MNDKKVAKHIAPILTGLQINHLSKKLLGGLGHILMLHRIVPLSEGFRVHNHESLEISPEQLEKIILFFKKANYEFLSLDQLHQKLQSKTFSSPFVVFTFDDGYKDNLTYAYPVFKKNNVPFTVFITTSFPDYSAIIWWYLLEDYLINRSHFSFKDGANCYSFKTHSKHQKEKAFTEIRRLFIQKADKDIPDFVQRVFSLSIDEIKKTSEKLCLSWDDIKKLAADPLVTVGAHTINHVGLLNRSIEEAKYEITESKRLIEDRIGKPVEHFSYPFGSKKEAGLREFELAKQAGYLTACTTQLGNIYLKHSEFLTSLPRISINSLTTMDVLKMQISGLIPFFRNNFNSVIKP